MTVETGTTDFTADEVPRPYSEHISAAAMERLRDLAKQERAPQDLVTLSDRDLLSALGVVREERLTHAGLLLAGREQSIRDHVPAYLWTYFRMRSDTEYDDRVDTAEPLPMALGRITDRIMASNPIATIKQSMFHFEYRTYPDIAIREALMNAFCHRDFRIPGPIIVKQYPERLEISNPGTFIGGISPDNILHHSPVSRSPLLVDALTRLRLINRGNLGIPRMFASMLMEGKEPPIIQEQGNTVKVTFLAGETSGPFRAFVADQSRIGHELTVDHLLILQYLIRHSEIDTSTAARVCQRQESEVREILSQMERQYSHIERGGTGRGTYWTMRSDLRRDLAADSVPERDARIDWETAKTRILSVLKQRAEHREPGLTNREIRQIVRLDRNQVYRLVRQLMEEEPRIAIVGNKRYARYEYR